MKDCQKLSMHQMERKYKRKKSKVRKNQKKINQNDIYLKKKINKQMKK